MRRFGILMDVVCGRCRAEYEFDDALISERGTTVRCTNCGLQFKVFPPLGQRSPEIWRLFLPDDPTQPVAEFSSLARLQKAISRGEVGPDHLLSRGTEAARRLSEIVELRPLLQQPPSIPPPSSSGREGSAAEVHSASGTRLGIGSPTLPESSAGPESSAAPESSALPESFRTEEVDNSLGEVIVPASDEPPAPESSRPYASSLSGDGKKRRVRSVLSASPAALSHSPVSSNSPAPFSAGSDGAEVPADRPTETMRGTIAPRTPLRSALASSQAHGPPSSRPGGGNRQAVGSSPASSSPASSSPASSSGIQPPERADSTPVPLTPYQGTPGISAHSAPGPHGSLPPPLPESEAKQQQPASDRQPPASEEEPSQLLDSDDAEEVFESELAPLDSAPQAAPLPDSVEESAVPSSQPLDLGVQSQDQEPLSDQEPPSSSDQDSAPASSRAPAATATATPAERAGKSSRQPARRLSSRPAHAPPSLGAVPTTRRSVQPPPSTRPPSKVPWVLAVVVLGGGAAFLANRPATAPVAAESARVDDQGDHEVQQAAPAEPDASVPELDPQPFVDAEVAWLAAKIAGEASPQAPNSVSTLKDQLREASATKTWHMVDVLRMEADFKRARELSAQVAGGANPFSLAMLDLAEAAEDPPWPIIVSKLKVAVRGDKPPYLVRSALIYSLISSSDVERAQTELSALSRMKGEQEAPLVPALRELLQSKESQSGEIEDTPELKDSPGAQAASSGTLAPAQAASAQAAVAAAAPPRPRPKPDVSDALKQKVSQADSMWRLGNREAALSLYKQVVAEIGTSHFLGQRSAARIAQAERERAASQ